MDHRDYLVYWVHLDLRAFQVLQVPKVRLVHMVLLVPLVHLVNCLCYLLNYCSNVTPPTLLKNLDASKDLPSAALVVEIELEGEIRQIQAPRERGGKENPLSST